LQRVPVCGPRNLHARYSYLSEKHYIASTMLALQSQPMARPPLTADTLGGRIREARENAGYSKRTKFADLIPAGHMTAYDWERNKYQPRLDNVQRIASLTGYSVAEIMGSDSEIPETLAKFLDTPFADGITDEEVDRLRVFPWLGPPTVEAYYHALLALRSRLTPEEAAEAARVTEEARRRAERAGLVDPSESSRTPRPQATKKRGGH
jgi:transcriptional regulator with XRE-family HTH domain